MSYCSPLRKNEIIVDENFRIDPLLDNTFGRGLFLRDYSESPFASGPTKPFDLQIIDPSEWKDRIREKDEKKTRNSDLADQVGLKCKNQSNTNYCWINAPVYCYESARVQAGLPLVYFSPASVGGPIKNYRNVGGWGSQGLEYMVAHGVVPESLWPANAISRQYYDETLEVRAKHKVSEFYDLEPRNWEQLITCLLLNIPVAIGLNWWSHEVTAVDAVLMSNGDIGVRIRNSWGMEWGDDGYSVLVKSKANPDDAVACPVVFAA